MYLLLSKQTINLGSILLTAFEPIFKADLKKKQICFLFFVSWHIKGPHVRC